MFLNINTDAAVVFTNKLEQMHRSALPSAVRGALNKTAFNLKTETMPRNANAVFENRQPNFFKANSKVEPAKGFDLKSMQATVGFIEAGLKGGNNFSVKDLEQQEHGGAIDKKSFIPMKPARVGATDAKPVRPGNRLSGIRKIVNARNAKGVNAGQRFVKSAIHAGKGGYVLSEYKGMEILWRVNSLNRISNGFRNSFKLTPMYSFKEGRAVSVKGTGFMKKSSLESEKQMEKFYIEEAQRQIKKLGG